MATSPGELQDLVSRVKKAAKEYKMIINAAKMKVMRKTSKTLEVLVHGGKLEHVDSFAYLSRITSEADCKAEVKTRLVLDTLLPCHGMVAMVKLTKMLKKQGNIKAPIQSYGCEAWTLKKEEERPIQAFQNKFIRQLLRIPWTRND